jgi:hypothetical protein
MRSNLQNSLDALFKSKNQQIVLKFDLNFPNMCFRLSIWPIGHRESQKYEFERGIGRRNEAAGQIILPPNVVQLKNHAFFFSHASLIRPRKYRTSNPKLVPTPLLLFGTSPLKIENGDARKNPSYLSFFFERRRPTKNEDTKKGVATVAAQALVIFYGLRLP